MSDAPTSSTNQVLCPADKDPAVRLFIGAGMSLAFSVWCILEMHKYAKPEAWDMKHVNEAAGYAMNHFGPWVMIPVGLFLIGWALKVLRRQIVADGDAMTVNGKRYAWSEFTGIDASLLASKGQLTLNRAGGEDVVLLRYQYKNFKALVELIEQHVSMETAANEG